MIFPVGRFLNQSQSQLPVFNPLQIPDLLFRPGDRKTIFIEKFLDLQDEIQVPSPVEPLKGSPLMGPDGFKFGFPVAKHMGFEARNAADLSNPIIKPFGGDQILIFLLLEQPDQRSPLRDQK